LIIGTIETLALSGDVSGDSIFVSAATQFLINVCGFKQRTKILNKDEENIIYFTLITLLTIGCAQKKFFKRSNKLV
jgi:hypothetical protein